MPGKTQLSHGLVAELRRRVDAGQSQRSIARALGIDRETVDRLADGGDELPSYERCAACGHLVLLPCRICAARNYAAG